MAKSPTALITRAQLIDLIVETEGKNAMSWYSIESGYSEKTIAGIKAELGLTKKRAPNFNSDPEVLKINEFADGLMTESFGRYESMQKVDQVMEQVRGKFTGKSKTVYEIIRKRLKNKWVAATPLQVDSHSGYVKALRLPLNQIASVVAS